MGTLGQSGLPPASTTEVHGGAVGGRWEPRGQPRKPRRACRMPTWLAVLVCVGAFFAPLTLLTDRRSETVDVFAFAALVWLATFSNLCAGLAATRDERRRAAFRWMYGWDWVALGASAVGGGAVLLLVGSRSEVFALGLGMATLATILGLLDAIRRRLAASGRSLAHVEDVFR